MPGPDGEKVSLARGPFSSGQFLHPFLPVPAPAFRRRRHGPHRNQAAVGVVKREGDKRIASDQGGHQDCRAEAMNSCTHFQPFPRHSFGEDDTSAYVIHPATQQNKSQPGGLKKGFRTSLRFPIAGTQRFGA